MVRCEGLEALVIKRAISYGMVKLRRHPELVPDVVETLHRAPSTRAYNDSVYFYGRGEDGLGVAIRLAIRTDATPEVWMSVKLPGQPIAAVAGGPFAEGEGFCAGPLKLEVVVPGTTWRLTYNGELERAGEMIDAQVELTFEGHSELVDFAKGVAPADLAEALAERTWDRDFFQKLGEIRTTHYEQAGTLKGTVTLDGERTEVSMQSMRDHSFGQRVWSQWRRHIWFSGLLENGQTFTATRIRYDFVGPLVAGFVEQGGTLTPVARSTAFDDIAPKGVIPDTFELEIRTADGRKHRLRAKVHDIFKFSLDDGDYTINEAIVDWELNGERGVGIAEFGWSPRD